MRSLAVQLLGLFLVLAGIAPTAAITYGLPDGETHPSVGLSMYRLEYPDPDLGTPASGSGRRERTTGMPISPH